MDIYTNYIGLIDSDISVVKCRSGGFSHAISIDMAGLTEWNVTDNITQVLSEVGLTSQLFSSGLSCYLTLYSAEMRDCQIAEY